MACGAFQLVVADLVSVTAMISTTTIIAIYNPSHPNHINILSELHYLIHEQFFKDPNTNVFETPWYLKNIIEPSAAVFCLAVLLYAFASSAFYRLHRRDQYQNHVLAAFAIAGVLLPVLCGVKIAGLKDWWQASLPWAYTLGLMFSAVGHWVARLMPREMRREDSMVDDYDFDWDRKIRGQKLP